MAENSNKKTCVNKLNQKINFQYPQKNLKNLKCLPCIIFPFRSSQQKCSVKKGVFRNFAKFTGKHLCQSLFAEPQPATLLKKRLWHWCFSVNFAKFLRTPFLQNTSERLHLSLCYHLKMKSLLLKRDPLTVPTLSCTKPLSKVTLSTQIC